MVKIAVAGGTGNVATCLLRPTIASAQHEITIFTRNPPSNPSPGVSYLQVDYHSRTALTTALHGFSICLSFLVAHQDPDCVIQKNLLHACIDAKVSRFAPSEWSIASNSGCPPYANKDEMARYLADLRERGELGNLEYCLFQPSVFMDYFAHPYALNADLNTWPFFLDFENRRAIVLDGGDQPIVVTAINDIAEILRLALEDTQPWPAVGGIRGCKTSINELLALGKKIRGGEWAVEHVRGKDIQQGELKTSWVPRLDHPVIPVDQRDGFSKSFIVMFFQAILNGSWVVGEQWNERFPEYEFVGVEKYLAEAWKGRA